MTVVAFSVDGEFVPLAVTDRVVAERPAFGVALAHVWPCEQPVAAAIAASRAAAVALGVQNGPTYTQLRIGPDGPKVGELATRLGGGHDAELCAAAVGVDANELALSAALGEPIAVPRPEPLVGGACVRFLVPPAGVLGSVEGVEAARAVDGVLDRADLPRAGLPHGRAAPRRRPGRGRARRRREPGPGARAGEARRETRSLRHRR